MSVLAVADFRTATVTSACSGLTLTTTEASDTNLPVEITNQARIFDDETNDHFESEATTLDIDVTYWAGRLYLPRRFTAVSSVQTRDEAGTLTTQDTAVYRLRSSLNSTGSKRVGGFDWLDIVPLSDGLNTEMGAYCWPVGPQTVRVTGTSGWTVTPGAVKRAVALLVYDHFKPLRNDLRRTDRWQTSDASFNTAESLPWGLPEADTTAENYRRESLPGVG